MPPAPTTTRKPRNPANGLQHADGITVCTTIVDKDQLIQRPCSPDR
jgi:hypothetical protein